MNNFLKKFWAGRTSILICKALMIIGLQTKGARRIPCQGNRLAPELFIHLIF